MKKLIMSKYSSVFLPPLGLLFQVMLYPILLMLGIFLLKGESIILKVIALIWLYIPVLSVGGIFIALNQIRKKYKSKGPIVGLILNILWLVCFIWIVSSIDLSDMWQN